MSDSLTEGRAPPRPQCPGKQQPTLKNPLQTTRSARTTRRWSLPKHTQCIIPSREGRAPPRPQCPGKQQPTLKNPLQTTRSARTTRRWSLPKHTQCKSPLGRDELRLVRNAQAMHPSIRKPTAKKPTPRGPHGGGPSRKIVDKRPAFTHDPSLTLRWQEVCSAPCPALK